MTKPLYSSLTLVRLDYRTLAFLLILISPLSGQPKGELKLHHFDLPCDTCHQPQAIGSPTQSVGSIENINKSCTSLGCHYYDPYLNHPVDVKLPDTVTQSVSSGDSQNINCLTCHEYSTEQQGRFLRSPREINFCASCHAKMSGSLLEQSHWRFTTEAHLAPLTSEDFADAGFLTFIGGLDLESRTCLSCHDDISATVPNEDETIFERKRRWKDTSSHPIGVDYQHKTFSRPGSYKYPLMEQDRIRLFDGKMGCGSCHSLYADTNKSLVVRYEMGDLCRQCHNK
jgi:predicted CXXCH cytochrome family protein